MNYIYREWWSSECEGFNVYKTKSVNFVYGTALKTQHYFLILSKAILIRWCATSPQNMINFQSDKIKKDQIDTQHAWEKREVHTEFQSETCREVSWMGKLLNPIFHTFRVMMWKGLIWLSVWFSDGLTWRHKSVEYLRVPRKLWDVLTRWGTIRFSLWGLCFTELIMLMRIVLL
jgi:hypothetical protein